MGLLSRLKEKKKEYQVRRETEKYTKERARHEYKKAYEKGRLAGAKKSGYKAGYEKAMRKKKPWYESLGDISKAMERSLDPTGEFLNPKQKGKKKRKEIDELLW